MVVVYQEWPEEDYPPYANGPGYVLSSDIARFIVEEFERHKLRVRRRANCDTTCLFSVIYSFFFCLCEHTPAVQDGGRECRNVGGAFQKHIKPSGLQTQS